MSGDARMRAMSCGEFQDLAPELGLGVLTGVERASALVHLESCTSCRTLVEDMAQVGDSLLLLAPEIEPPAGFESRLLARRSPVPETSARRLRWAPLSPARRWQAVAATVAVVAAVAGIGLGLAGRGQAGFRVEHPGVVSALGGRELAVAALRSHGQELGQVFVYSGQPSWVFMTVDADSPPQQVTCELEVKGGRTVVLGTFALSSVYSSWGSTVAVDPSLIQGVRLVSAHARTVATAYL